MGLSLSLIAAVLGAVYIVYGALAALVHRRIGADFALAQACIAALVLGQPFVAAEVVFIALVGEVLEARDVRPDEASPGAAGRGDPAHRPGAAGRRGRRDPGSGRGRRRPRDRPAGRADPRRRAGRVGPIDGRSVGPHRRVDPGRQGAGRSGLHRHAQPVRRDRGPRGEGRPRDGAGAGRSPGRAGPAQEGRRGADGRSPGAVLLAGRRDRRRADPAGGLPPGLARRLVADGRRAGRRLPLRAGAGHSGRDARQHGLAGPPRRPDQGGLRPRASGRRATPSRSTRRAP